MDDLASRHCVACRGDTPRLEGEELARFAKAIDGDWQVVDQHHLVRRFRFADFAGALAFVNQVGAIAEAENHHPDLYLAWGRVGVEIWTHAIDGLSESDFILAAKIDRLAAAAAAQ